MIPFLVKTYGMFPMLDNTPVTFTSSYKCLGRKIKIQIPSSVVNKLGRVNPNRNYGDLKMPINGKYCSRFV